MTISTDDVRVMAAERLALAPRLGYTGLLLVALAGAAVTGSLWLTEDGLPARTRIAFALMLGLNLCWAGFAAWVLTRRRVLLAQQSVVAGRMAVAFSALFVLFAWIAAQWGGGGRAMYLASASGLVMLAIAAAVLVRAGRRLESLIRRRTELELALRGRTPSGRGDLG
jgi:hypothetical protein